RKNRGDAAGAEDLPGPQITKAAVFEDSCAASAIACRIAATTCGSARPRQSQGACREWASRFRQHTVSDEPASSGRVGEPASQPGQQVLHGSAPRAAERSRGRPVTTFEQPAAGTEGVAPRTYRKGSILADWLSSTDHKVIGHLYLITSFAFFLIGGLMAMIMRA